MPKPLSPAARAVIQATSVEACLAEWGPVNDPPCHPDDEGWNGCHLCVKSDLIAAALRAAADKHGELEVPFNVIDDWEKVKGSCASFYAAAEWGYNQALKKLLTIATELEAHS